MTELQRVVLVFIIAFEVAFTQNIVTNLVLIALSFAVLCYHREHYRVY